MRFVAIGDSFTEGLGDARPDGTLRGWADLVEVEGDHHRTDRRQWDRDIEKYNAYAALGWEVVRLTSTHVRGAKRGVSLVRDALLRNGWRPDRGSEHL